MTTLCVLTITFVILACGGVGRPIVTQDITQTTVTATQITATNAQSTHSIIFAHDVDFAGPGGNGTPGVHDSSFDDSFLEILILDTAAHTEATASSQGAKQTLVPSSTILAPVVLSDTYESKVTSSITQAINNRFSFIVNAALSTEMPVTAVPAQAAPQRLEQIASMSLSDEVLDYPNAPNATIDLLLKETMHTLYAPWHAPSSASPESILFNKNIQALIVALAHAHAGAEAAIWDEMYTQDVGLEGQKSVEGISDYKRWKAPAGLEWQLKAMKENDRARESPKSKRESFKRLQNRISSAPEYYTPRKSARAKLASFVQEQEDDLSSFTDYYFTSAPNEASDEAEQTSRRSLDSAMENETEKGNPSFDRGDVAGQIITGKAMALLVVFHYTHD
ncbi:5027_t:CDS:2 [Acaulospora colombiana]|uniref:5027_t:CDS:1 n=1 Tax=Acaulospora colombiana TaxID=27376 RepID=A0ACA9LHE7_9GLOM|nr:5027_t:CDS:2 [Acaulospora colombiana]